MRASLTFTVCALLLLTGSLAGAAEEPAASGWMRPATNAPTLVPNPASECLANSSPAKPLGLAFEPEQRIPSLNECGTCGNCTQPRTACNVFGQGWGICNFTMQACGADAGGGRRCECQTGGGNP